MMSLYYILVNDDKKEFVSLDDYDLSIVNWGTVQHGLLVSYILQYSSWFGDCVKFVSDGAGLNETYHKIIDTWINKTDEFVNDFNITLETNQKRYRINKSK